MSTVPTWLRRNFNAMGVHFLFRSMDALGLMGVRGHEKTRDVETFRDIAYGNNKAHRLDVWRPRDLEGPLPTVLFIHGGGFTEMSRRTHWTFARALARQGYLVFSIDYRLAPEHPYPAALEDACEAWCWMVGRVREYGGDPEHLVLMGESAGANLALGVSIAATAKRREPWARKVFSLGAIPRAVVSLSGLLQVSHPERFAEFGVPRLIRAPIQAATRAYLPGPLAMTPDLLADPLLWLESARPTHRPFPAVFGAIGTRDPLRHDTARLEAALTRRGVRHDVRTYAGGVHSFMAFLWTKKAQRCWSDLFSFLSATVRGTHRVPLLPTPALDTCEPPQTYDVL